MTAISEDTTPLNLPPDFWRSAQAFLARVEAENADRAAQGLPVVERKPTQPEGEYRAYWASPAP